MNYVLSYKKIMISLMAEILIPYALTLMVFFTKCIEP